MAGGDVHLPAKASGTSLLDHSLAAEAAAERLFDPAGRWGRAFARFFGVDPERLQLHVRVAALLHDIGKANDEFARAVRGGGRQSVRHEHLSALVLSLPEVRRWLGASDRLDVDAIVAAVLSHHFKAARGGEHRWCQPRGAARVQLHLRHPDVRALLEAAAARAGLEPPPLLPDGPWQDASPWREAHRAGLAAEFALRRAMKGGPERRNLVLATKAGLVAADAAGSAILRTGCRIDDWIRQRADLVPLEGWQIEGDVIEPRGREIERRTGQPFRLHRFQQGVAEQGPRVLLLAACAAGKTLAAWNWAAAQARHREVGRVVFLYPTRGTATEGFRDHLLVAGDRAALVHGTAEYDLEGLQPNPGRDESAANQEKLFALRHWDRRYISATVDQFLGFLEHAYASTCLLPVLADAAVVVDEVHSFDDGLFDKLVAFLEHFQVPVLCMTATLPPSRRERLLEAGLRAYPRPEDRGELRDLEEQEARFRYGVRVLANRDEALDRATEAYRAGRRVLWVVNTVARCQEVADLVEARLGSDVLLYHARFRLVDRRAAHRATVEAFQQVEAPAFAVTTQVCEMSLDLDADLLVTETAPVPSLVQRMGRANRHGHLDAADVLVYPAPSPPPYETDELVAADAFLSEIAGRRVSQRDLALALEHHAVELPSVDSSARFLDGSYFAIRGTLRDGDGPSASAVLDSDLDEVRAAIAAGRPFDGWVLPVRPRDLKHGFEPPRGWPRHLGTVESSRYDSRKGFMARREGEA